MFFTFGGIIENVEICQFTIEYGYVLTIFKNCRIINNNNFKKRTSLFYLFYSVHKNVNNTIIILRLIIS